MNDDWPDEWIFDDPRFGLADRDDRLLRFLADLLYPAVRTDPAEVERLIGFLNGVLVHDGYELVQVDDNEPACSRLRTTTPRGSRRRDHPRHPDRRRTWRSRRIACLLCCGRAAAGPARSATGTPRELCRIGSRHPAGGLRRRGSAADDARTTRSGRKSFGVDPGDLRRGVVSAV
ncbi:hypothetical protein [Micromonospora sp. NPDC092111]|uniref:AbiJ-related protein n=1 Tax=Micromonospora sp. NPDC092111 TaxID=3364289 RepID=UPI00382DC19A